MFAAGAALHSHWELYGSGGSSVFLPVYSCLSLKDVVDRRCVTNNKGIVCVCARWHVLYVYVPACV